MSGWSNRIKERMKLLGITQEALANKMGITRGAVTHYLAGRRVPPLAQFIKLAAILKTDPAWLNYGTVIKAPKAKTDKNCELTHQRIPIFSWEQVANFLNTKHLQNESKEFIPHLFVDKPHWYALRIKGDAMTAPLGNCISFREGDMIIVDPEKTPSHNSFVIALLPRAKEVTFKQYVIDGGIRYLKPLNPQYPLIEIDENTYICGTVVQNINLL